MSDNRIDVRVHVGDLALAARLEWAVAPRTCEAFVAQLPLSGRLLQARWSGEAAWVPLGELDFGVSLENATSYPAPGQVLLYPGGYSETELLFPYGATRFASKLGQLAGNHFLTLVDADAQLREIGRRVVWEGAQEIRISAGS